MGCGVREVIEYLCEEDEVELDYGRNCPKCNETPVATRPCLNLGCDDGLIDGYEDDPLWYQPGEYETCSECGGVGVLIWCPSCGADLRSANFAHQA